MNFAVRDLRIKDIPLFSLFVISIVGSMLLVMIYKGQVLLQTEVLSVESLSLIYDRNRNGASLFLFVCKERIWVIPLLFLLSTTYLASGAVYFTVFRYGAGIGTLLAIALMRYGMRGIFLLIICGIPQYILYVPAMAAALRLSSVKRAPNRRFFLQLILLELVVIIGCILEGYVNLIFLEKILKIILPK